MSRDAALRQEDPIDGLRTVHLIEEALVQRGLRQLRELLRDPEGKRLLDELRASALANVHDLEDVLAEWTRGAASAAAPRPELPGPDRAEILRSFVDLKETEALVLARAARTAPPALRERLERLARDARSHADKLGHLTEAAGASEA